MTDLQLKDRNAALCLDWLEWHDSELPKSEQVSVFILRLSAKYEIAERTIYQILENNADAFLSKKNYEKVKRIFRLKREIAQKEKSNKDVADLMDQLRREYEGDKPLIDNSKHITNVTINKIDLDERLKIIKENRCFAVI
jgi:hypothetical protein